MLWNVEPTQKPAAPGTQASSGDGAERAGLAKSAPRAADAHERAPNITHDGQHTSARPESVNHRRPRARRAWIPWHILLRRAKQQDKGAEQEHERADAARMSAEV